MYTDVCNQAAEAAHLLKFTTIPGDRSETKCLGIGARAIFSDIMMSAIMVFLSANSTITIGFAAVFITRYATQVYPTAIPVYQSFSILGTGPSKFLRRMIS